MIDLIICASLVLGVAVASIVAALAMREWAIAVRHLIIAIVLAGCIYAWRLQVVAP